MFKLDESLKICLVAVVSRYPDSLVEINKNILNRSDLWEGLCKVKQALQHLQIQAPQLSRAPACVLIDEGQAISAIYLLDRSEEVPALYLYSGRNGGQPYRHGLHEPVITLQRSDDLLELSQSRPR
jgi:hypothetical protein